MGTDKNIKLHIVTDIKIKVYLTIMEDIEYFIREVEYSCGTLNIYQATIGDVGHVVWDAALVLSKFMDTVYLKETYSMNGKVVVELGAGTGIVSLLAAMLGATVYATDLEELVP